MYYYSQLYPNIAIAQIWRDVNIFKGYQYNKIMFIKSWHGLFINLFEESVQIKWTFIQIGGLVTQLRNTISINLNFLIWVNLLDIIMQLLWLKVNLWYWRCISVLEDFNAQYWRPCKYKCRNPEIQIHKYNYWCGIWMRTIQNMIWYQNKKQPVWLASHAIWNSEVTHMPGSWVVKIFVLWQFNRRPDKNALCQK